MSFAVVGAAALAAAALIIGTAYGNASAAHADALAVLDQQTADLTAQVEASDVALAAQNDRATAAGARLNAALATAEPWKTELAVGADADLTTLEQTAASLSGTGNVATTVALTTHDTTPAIALPDPNARPAAPEAPVIVGLRAELADRDARLADLTERADSLERTADDYAAAWRARIATWATTTADAAAAASPHAPTARQTVSSTKDQLVAVEDVFGAGVPQTMQALRDGVAAMQAEEAAWQQAEAARVAEAARAAAEASRRSASSGGSSGSSSRGGSSGGGASGGGAAVSGSGIDRTGELLGLVNQARAAAGLGPLGSSSSLAGTSCAQSQWMSDTGRFEHGATSGWRGENIAWGFSSAQSVFTAWMNSEGHRANILRPSFTSMGGCQVGAYWTQQFG